MENNLNKMNEELQSVNEATETTTNDVVETKVEEVMEISDAPVKQPKKKKIKEKINIEETIDISNVEVEQEVRGLGDIIKKVADTLSIPTCEDCEQRRLKLNKMFPFTKTAKRELTESEIEFVNGIGTKLTTDDRMELGRIAEEVLGGKVRHCQCPSMYKQLIDRLKIQIEYQNIK